MPEIDLNQRPHGREDLSSWYAAALADQASSDLSVAEYAEAIGVTATTLYQWRRRLASRSRKPRSQASPVGLVEVSVECGALTPNESESFIVQLGCDRRIEVPPQFDAAELGRLVTLLESC